MKTQKEINVMHNRQQGERKANFYGASARKKIQCEKGVKVQ